MLLFAIGIVLAAEVGSLTDTIRASIVSVGHSRGQNTTGNIELLTRVQPGPNRRLQKENTDKRPALATSLREPEDERRKRLSEALPYTPESIAIANRIRVRLRFHALYDLLGWGKSQIDKFETAAAARFSSIDPFGFTLGMYEQNDEAALLKGRVSNLDKVFQDVAPDVDVSLINKYVQESDIRNVVESLAVYTFHFESPLSASQSDRLLQACVESYNGDRNVVRLDPSSVDWNSVTQQAQAFLTPQQLAAFREMINVMAVDVEFRKATGLPYRRPIRGL